MKKRFILFGEISAESDNIFTYLMDTDSEYSFTDQLMKEIEAGLVVRSVEEYRERFEKFINYDESDEEFKGDYYDAFKRDLATRKDTFEVYYSFDSMKSDNNGAYTIGNRFYFEVLEGLSLLFKQRPDDTEVLILNVNIASGISENERKLLKLYLETANTKIEQKYFFNAAILPDLFFPQNSKKVRQIFQGNKEELRNTIDCEQVIEIAKLVEDYSLPLLVQYETVPDAGASGFAQWGEKYYRLGCDKLYDYKELDNIIICYPNLSSPNDNLFIGAAFATAALIACEDEASLIPREIFPYSKTAREDVDRARFGAMLVCQRNRMELACHKSLKGNTINV